MPFIPVADTARVSLNGTVLGQENINTFHFKAAAPITAANRAALAAAMNTFVTVHWLPVMSNQLSISSIDVVDLTSQFAGSSQFVYAPPALGSVPGAIKPTNVAWCATHRTANRGRNFRGRTYVPAIPDGYVSLTDFLGAVPIGDILSALSWLLTAANTAGMVWSVVSKFLGNAPRANGIATAITAVTGDNTLDSMRRRLPLRGA